MPEIETKRLRLRPPVPADVDALVAGIASDPEIALFIPGMPSPYGAGHARLWLDGIPDRRAAINEVPFAICERDDGDGDGDRGHGELLGVISVRLHPGGSLGYWLRMESRRQGLMTEALIAVVRWAARQGASDLHLMTHPDNLASQRVAEKAGFVRGGMVIHEPPFLDGGMRALRFESPR